jgi:large subunit ribosomal protein L30
LAGKIRVVLKRSLARKPESLRAVAASLGLRKREGAVVHSDTRAVRGMIRKIEHLVSVEKVEEVG